MDNETLEFPDYFPNNCPPRDATSTSCLLFRLCQSDIPVESDFITFYEINPQKYAGFVQAYGLSVFGSAEDCEKARRKSAALRNKYKAFCSGMNTPERGKTLSTPSKTNPAHITWWLYKGIKPHTFFVHNEEGGAKNE